MSKHSRFWAIILAGMSISVVAAEGDIKTPAAPTENAGESADANGSAQWKHWPDSNIYPDDGAVFGVAVERTTGDLFIVHKPSAKAWTSPAEIWKSSDQAKTFSKANNTINGVLLSSYAFSFDPLGKRMAFFLMYGGGGMSIDGGLNWTPFASVKPREFDCGVVDWEGTAKTCLALCHESDPAGKLVLSNDSGATWQELGTGFTGPIGLFDAKTLIVGSKGGSMQRSTDGGATWTKVDNAPKMNPGIQSVVVFKGAGYLVTPQGLSVSKDKGATWVLYGTPVNISGMQKKFRSHGPFFGVDERHIVLVGWDGVFQTTDGGAHWIKVAPFPEEIPHPPAKSGSESFAWDPVHNIVYASARNAPAVYCQLPPPAKH